MSPLLSLTFIDLFLSFFPFIISFLDIIIVQIPIKRASGSKCNDVRASRSLLVGLEITYDSAPDGILVNTREHIPRDADVDG